MALSRALAVRPELVLLDEPYSALDPVLREGLRGEVAALLRAEGRAALHVTHDPDEALTVADRVVVLGAGRVLDEGPPLGVYRDPANLASARTGPAQRAAGRGARRRVRLDEWRLRTDVPDGPARVAFRWEDARVVQSGVAATFGRESPLRGARLGRFSVGGHLVAAELTGRTPEPGETVRLDLGRPWVFALQEGAG